MMVVTIGSGMSLLAREEEEQCDHSATAMPGVLPEYSVPNISSGYGDFHKCSHTEGNIFWVFIVTGSRNEIKMIFHDYFQ